MYVRIEWGVEGKRESCARERERDGESMQCMLKNLKNLKWHEAAIRWQCHICLQTTWSGPSSLICQAGWAAKCFGFFNSSRVGWRLENDCIPAWPDCARSKLCVIYIQQRLVSIWVRLEDCITCSTLHLMSESWRDVWVYYLICSRRATTRAQGNPSSPFGATSEVCDKEEGHIPTIKYFDVLLSGIMEERLWDLPDRSWDAAWRIRFMRIA